jgi:hypothetical protein
MICNWQPKTSNDTIFVAAAIPKPIPESILGRPSRKSKNANSAPRQPSSAEGLLYRQKVNSNPVHGTWRPLKLEYLGS